MTRCFRFIQMVLHNMIRYVLTIDEANSQQID